MPELKGKGYRVSYLNLGSQVAATIQVRRPVMEGSAEFSLAEALVEIAEELDKKSCPELANIGKKEAVCQGD